MKDELLWNQKAIELKGRVRNDEEHRRDRTDLDDSQREQVGTRVRRRRWRLSW